MVSLMTQMTLTGGDIETTNVNIPKGYDQAIASELAADWLKVVPEENENMWAKTTHEKVDIKDLPAGVNIVSCRWVFDAKTLGNGKLERLKARIVVWGFEGIKGVDYLQTFTCDITPNDPLILRVGSPAS